MKRSDRRSLRAWAAELEAAATIARTIADTAFMPDSHRRFTRDPESGRLFDGREGRPYRLDLEATVATAAAAIMTGEELDLDPMASLRSIAVINNTPALSALTLRAILQSAGHDIWVADSTGTRAVVRARRAGTEEIQQSTWTLDRAKTAGLYPGPDRGQWRRNPTAMLVARATAEAARYIAADAILGIPYIAEELLDELEGSGPPLAITAAGEPTAAEPAAVEAAEPKRRTRRKSAATSAPAALPTGPRAEPEVRAEPAEVTAANAGPVPAEPEAPAEPITKAQMDRLHTGLREVGISGRDAGLRWLSIWVGREVGSTKTLTIPEAAIALDRLDALREIRAGLDAIGVTGTEEALALVSEWAGRRVPALPDLTEAEAAAVRERLAALASLTRPDDPEGSA